MINAGIGMKKYVFVGIGIFFVIVLLAVCISARFSLTNITADPYKFIEGFFDRWSPALAAAGTIIVAVLAGLSFYESRRSEERDREQAIHALHDEIHSNLTDIIGLRFRISEQLRVMDEHRVVDPESMPFQLVDTAVFDSMKNHGQLHWLQEMRMNVIFCYKVIQGYNQAGVFKPHHLDILATINDCMKEAIRALEAKFKFLPRYVREAERGSKSEEVGDSIRKSERSIKTMDKEVAAELEKIHGKLIEVDTKLDKGTKDQNRLTSAVVGFSIAMAGIMVWIQTEMWSSAGTFLIFFGTLLMGLVALMHKAGFLKWIRIVFWVALCVLIALLVAVVIIVLSH